MKTLLIFSILALTGYFGFSYLPENIQADIKHSADSLGLSRLSPANLLPPLKAKIAPLTNVIKPEDPVATRAEIIQKLEKQISAIAETSSSASPKEKAALQEAVSESKKLIDELKTENPKGGILSDTADRILDALLPSTATSSSPVCSQP